MKYLIRLKDNFRLSDWFMKFKPTALHTFKVEERTFGTTCKKPAANTIMILQYLTYKPFRRFI